MTKEKDTNKDRERMVSVTYELEILKEMRDFARHPEPFVERARNRNGPVLVCPENGVGPVRPHELRRLPLSEIRPVFAGPEYWEVNRGGQDTAVSH